MAPLSYSLRPSLRAYLGRIRTATFTTWVVLVAAAAVVVLSGVLGSATFWSAFAIAVTITLIRVIRGVRRERVEFGGGQYRVRGRDGRWREFSADDVGVAAAIRTRAKSGGYSRVDLGDFEAARLARIAGGYWRPVDLGRLVDDLRSQGIDVDSLSPRQGVDGLAHRHSWALSPWEAHTRALSIAAAVLLGAGLFLERLLTGS